MCSCHAGTTAFVVCGCHHINILPYIQYNTRACSCPCCSNLARLDHLSLHSNDMVLVPPELGACTAMTWLSLNANKLHVLPPSLGQMTNLIRL